MNYHSDLWIMQRLQEHYEEALTIFPKDKILSIHIQGSQNYGLDYSSSDIDTKCIVLPTLEEICLNKQATSYTYIRANNEHIDFKDLRVISRDLLKQNITFLEILFTKHKIVNEDYAKLFDMMFTYNEDIARYDNYRFIRATAGMSMEKLKALTLNRPSQHDEIVKYGWSTKQLHHLMRLNTFIKRWVNDEAFEDCLIDPRSEYLTMIKQDGHSMFTLDEAKFLAKKYDDETNTIKEEYIATHEHVINDTVGRMIDDIVVDVVRESLKKEIG